jgi:hypothetical protein
MTRHGRHVSESGLARLYTRSGGNATRRRCAAEDMPFVLLSINACHIRNLAESSHRVSDHPYLATSRDASLSPSGQVPAAWPGIYHRRSARRKHLAIDKFVCEIEKNVWRNRRKALDKNLTRPSLFY